MGLARSVAVWLRLSFCDSRPGRTALHMAVEHGKQAMVRLLLRQPEIAGTAAAGECSVYAVPELRLPPHAPAWRLCRGLRPLRCTPQLDAPAQEKTEKRFLTSRQARAARSTRAA